MKCVYEDVFRIYRHIQKWQNLRSIEKLSVTVSCLSNHITIKKKKLQT